jgi:hypothetical protein
LRLYGFGLRRHLLTWRAAAGAFRVTYDDAFKRFGYAMVRTLCAEVMHRYRGDCYASLASIQNLPPTRDAYRDAKWFLVDYNTCRTATPNAFQ